MRHNQVQFAMSLDFVRCDFSSYADIIIHRDIDVDFPNTLDLMPVSRGDLCAVTHDASARSRSCFWCFDLDANHISAPKFLAIFSPSGRADFDTLAPSDFFHRDHVIGAAVESDAALWI